LARTCFSDQILLPDVLNPGRVSSERDGPYDQSGEAGIAVWIFEVQIIVNFHAGRSFTTMPDSEDDHCALLDFVVHKVWPITKRSTPGNRDLFRDPSHFGEATKSLPQSLQII
jgi:hypothetical protein